MERGRIAIENNNVSVNLANGTVWLSQYQIADLFGVFTSAVNNNIRAILKAGILNEDKICYLFTDSNRKIVPLYNLEMITALAFRLTSHQTEVFRKWLLSRNSTTAILWKLPRIDAMLN
ncbi:hypothetical protein EZS27_024330 [termite gut metagenome]|jgi:hypothetical protein|uniref:Uncharacterized protein n=1 Tax=termite gut metagenome TaxID=433724 RepID=A0A5J4R043_9ZZZZ